MVCSGSLFTRTYSNENRINETDKKNTSHFLFVDQENQLTNNFFDTI